MSDPVVVTGSGAVRGRTLAECQVFHAIPYAAAPEGRARFAAPEPHPPWPGIRDATMPGPTAPQPRRDGFGRLDMSPFFGPGWVRDPDYLTVNIWTPHANATAGQPYPVMVFVHGGGFVAGSTRTPLYDGSAFARDGVVLVTVTYRLGIAGFLDIAGAPRNRGLLDVLTALAWVRDNIAAFGGDPDNVTLFGQSAGATTTAGVLAEAQAPTLIRRAIMQSGNPYGAFSPDQAERVSRAVADALGVEPTVDDLAGIPDEILVGVAAELGGLDLRVGDRFDPLVGLSPFSLVSDRQTDPTAHPEVGVLIGTTTEEGNLYLVPQGHLDISTEEDVHALAARVHPDPDTLVQDYRTRHPRACWGALRSTILGDALFRTGSERFALGRQASARTYRYEFGWRSTGVGGELGAAHAMELPFVFDRADVAVLRGSRGLLGDGQVPPELVDEIHGAWVRFATTGDPGWVPNDLRRWR
ncbi:MULTISPECIES: carboxylesterase/lipase family protein [Mycolicibacterium]|uniref:carboxylesterase/lipase family protein n=1 Tax=Mycolicibacterium monacense TaxID=85693 RepID=UPI0007E9E009|nr:carboxylesterase family protein [Mycolicibacterium monacense]OBB58427.1 carboxylesterase [Mycolicibacterium monacense]